MKLHVTEGGYRVPGIIRWPGRVKPGSESAEPVCNVDVLPTFCALAGVPLPDRKLDGADIAPIFEGQPIRRPHPLYWQYDFAISKPWAVALRLCRNRRSEACRGRRRTTRCAAPVWPGSCRR